MHRQDRIGITIDEFPTAVMDVIACNRMLRRSFWDRIGLTFPEGVAYEDHAPMMTAYVRATTFDILRAVTYYWRIRENQTSIGQQKRQTQNLKDRVRAKEDAAEVLKAYASAKVRDAWLQRVLDLDLTGFINQVEVTDEAYWDVLSHAARTFLRAATPEVLSRGQGRPEGEDLARGAEPARRADRLHEPAPPRGFPHAHRGGRRHRTGAAALPR